MLPQGYNKCALCRSEECRHGGCSGDGRSKLSTLFTEYFDGHTWEKKIVGASTEGVSNMLGKNNGFFASVVRRKPKSVYITKRSTRCCSHVGIHARESALLTSQRSSGLQFMHNFGVCLTTKDACGCIPT